MDQLRKGISRLVGPDHMTILDPGIQRHGLAVHHQHSQRKCAQHRGSGRQPPAPAAEFFHRDQQAQPGDHAVNHLAGPHDRHHQSQNRHVQEPHPLRPVRQVQAHRGKVGGHGQNHHIVGHGGDQVQRHRQQPTPEHHLFPKGHPPHGQITHSGVKQQVKQTSQKQQPDAAKAQRPCQRNSHCLRRIRQGRGVHGGLVGDGHAIPGNRGGFPAARSRLSLSAAHSLSHSSIRSRSSLSAARRLSHSSARSHSSLSASRPPAANLPIGILRHHLPQHRGVPVRCPAASVVGQNVLQVLHPGVLRPDEHPPVLICCCFPHQAVGHLVGGNIVGHLIGRGQRRQHGREQHPQGEAADHEHPLQAPLPPDQEQPARRGQKPHAPDKRRPVPAVQEAVPGPGDAVPHIQPMPESQNGHRQRAGGQKAQPRSPQL